jgi:type III restriction enzyme
MTIKKLRPYQEDAIEELILKTKLLLKRDNRTIVFQSPTGSGKTFMTSQYIEQLMKKLPEEDICFLWVSIGKGGLHVQSQESLKSEFQGFPECNLLEEEFFGSRKTIDQNEVVVVNWEKLRTKDGDGEWKNILMKDKETINFRELAKNTREEKRKIIMIIDESHAGRDTHRSVELIDDIISPDIIIEMSATPVNRENAEKVIVDPTKVIEQGMIKKEIIINSEIDELNEDELNSQELIMKTAFNKRLELKKQFKEEGVDLNPLVLVQLPNSDAGEDKRSFVESFLATKKITTDNKKLAVWMTGDENKINNEREIVCPNDSEVEFLVFKQAIDTGWDCPRAHILVRFREIKSITFEIQTVGRILRMPEAKHYVNDELNRGFVYLNASEFNVKQEDYNPNIIKSAISRRKPYYENLKLESYYRNRLDYGDITSSFYENLENVFCKEFGIEKDKASKKKISEKIDIKGLDASDEIILNEKLDMKEFDKLRDKNISGEDLNANLSQEDGLVVFENLIKKNLGSFAPKRSVSTVKQAIYNWFKKYLGVKLAGTGLIYIQNICLNNLGFFDILINKSIEEYKPTKESEVKKKIEEAEHIIIDWEIEPTRNFNPNTYKRYDYDFCAYDPCYLNFDSAIEEDFVKYLEKNNKKIMWWWQNGNEHMQSNFGIKCSDNSTFQPDFLVMFKDGRLGIFDTKASGDREDKNKIKGEALQDYILKQNKKGKKIFGGLIISENEKFRLNQKEDYLTIREKTGDWDFFDDLFGKNMISKDFKGKKYNE